MCMKIWRPPLWSSGQSSWLQIQRSRFDSQCYHIFWEVVGLERGPLSLVSTTEELLGRKSIGSCLENQDCSSRDLPRWPCNTLYLWKLALTSTSSGSHSIGTVHSQTKATEFVHFVFWRFEVESIEPRQLCWSVWRIFEFHNGDSHY
jgi:hypothetical protein